MQALVTKWFHDDNSFTITSIELQGPGYDFDIEIADDHGNKYDVEVWYGKSRVAHAMVDSATQFVIGAGGVIVHEDDGIVPEDKKDIMTDLGGTDIDPMHDFPKVMKKIEQLRDDHVGFLIACRQNYPPRLFQDIPQEWGCRLPKNKCVIVLYLNNIEFEIHGAGYVVHHPEFAYHETAKRIIQSLGFEYTAEKVRTRFA